MFPDLRLILDSILRIEVKYLILSLCYGKVLVNRNVERWSCHCGGDDFRKVKGILLCEEGIKLRRFLHGEEDIAKVGKVLSEKVGEEERVRGNVSNDIVHKCDKLVAVENVAKEALQTWPYVFHIGVAQ